MGNFNILLESGKLTMMLFSRLTVGIICLLRSIVPAKVKDLIFNLYTRYIFSTIAFYVKKHALESSLTVFHDAPILAILRLRSWSNISDSIISANAVSMISRSRRPDAMHIEPCQSMPRIPARVYGNLYISIVKYIASLFASIFGIPSSKPATASRSLFPSKGSGFWVVVQNRMKIFLCKDSLISYADFSHNVPPVRLKVRGRQALKTLGDPVNIYMTLNQHKQMAMIG